MSKLLKGVKYQGQSSIQKEYQISGGTLRLLADSGKIDCIRIGLKGKRLYDVSSLQKYLGVVPDKSVGRKAVIYARVSSAHQKQDLLRQIEDLKRAYPDHEVISDVGSGLNYKRKGLRSLLEQTHSGAISEVVVAHKDRLARYGTELIEQLFSLGNTRLVVLNKLEGRDYKGELSDDLLAVTTFFVARHNGMRSAENKRRRKALESQNREDIPHACSEKEDR